MPYCRHCHEKITKFDTDICPHCGGEKPIAEGYRTMDITRTITRVEGEDYEMPKVRSQKTFAILCMCLGFFGIHDFYIFRYKRAAFCLCSTLVLVAAVGSALFFSGALHNVLAFLIPFFVLWVAYVALGLAYWKIEAPKDGHGDFLR